MRALFVQHQDDCPPGHVGERLAQLGAELTVVQAKDAEWPDPAGFDLVVPLGSDDCAGDESVAYLRGEWELITRAVALDVAVFGICFGAQLLCRVLGGAVTSAGAQMEIGWLPLGESAEPVGAGPWLLWHQDVMQLGPASRLAGRSPAGVAAFTHGRHVGVQFHPEATIASIEVWADHYREQLAELGIAPATMVATAAARAAESRTAAFALVDRVLAHAGLRTQENARMEAN